MINRMFRNQMQELVLPESALKETLRKIGGVFQVKGSIVTWRNMVVSSWVSRVTDSLLRWRPLFMRDLLLRDQILWLV